MRWASMSCTTSRDNWPEWDQFNSFIPLPWDACKDTGASAFHSNKKFFLTQTRIKISHSYRVWLRPFRLSVNWFSCIPLCKCSIKMSINSLTCRWEVACESIKLTCRQNVEKTSLIWVGLARLIGLSCVTKMFPRPKKIIWINFCSSYSQPKSVLLWNIILGGCRSRNKNFVKRISPANRASPAHLSLYPRLIYHYIPFHLSLGGGQMPITINVRTLKLSSRTAVLTLWDRETLFI